MKPQLWWPLRGYGFPLVTGNIISGGCRLDLGALTADPWNIKPEMFSLGENLVLLQEQLDHCTTISTSSSTLS